MRLVVTDEAQEEIERIADYISKDNSRAAARLVKDFLRSFREIRERPRAYPFVVGYERRQLRRKVHRNYLIFYRRMDDRIEIVHVLHGAMDYETILGERE